MSQGYDSISLPKEFVKKIDKVIETTEYGYKSRAEFIKEAVRIHLKQYGFLFEELDHKNTKDK
jgi:metal-responsive CopG/Arc/MetJ family transcriptional regulator